MSELRLELPYEFHREEYEQILHDTRHLIAPELGWRPAAPTTQEATVRGAVRKSSNGPTSDRTSWPPL
ncbi:hypothetical protein ACIRP7_21920 [Streptomyces sp. NPDC102270]|uniref:hypothetical protein n=1 Tax=Streptomyces sp. NPDC102270 TaxID=3366150 RepID=UPI00381EB5FB